MKRQLKEIIGAVAPTIATALGGPLAGIATRAIAGKLLGNEAADPVAVERAIAEATGTDLAKLKELEFEFRAQMEEAGIELERVAAGDRDSARNRQAAMKDWTPSALGLVVIIGFFGVLAYIFAYGLPAQGDEVLLIMVGSLGAMTTQVGNYFFGSSVGSKTKESIIADLKRGGAV